MKRCSNLGLHPGEIRKSLYGMICTGAMINIRILLRELYATEGVKVIQWFSK